MHYGTDSTRERPYDRGSPSSEQHSQESLRALSKRHGINQKTVAKRKKRTAVKDLPAGPKDAHSTVLSIEDEAGMAFSAVWLTGKCLIWPFVPATWPL